MSLLTHLPPHAPFKGPATFHWPTLKFGPRYAWFIVLGFLDLVVTGIILELGGSEVNMAAAWIIGAAGMLGLTLFKILDMLVVISVCEWLGRLAPRVGNRLSLIAIVVAGFPAVVGLVQLSNWMLGWLGA